MLVYSYMTKIKVSINQCLWPESASDLYQPSDRRLSAKLVPTLADKRCHVVSVTDPYGHNLGFLDRKTKACTMQLKLQISVKGKVVPVLN
jgi:hypothetical protein